jgi:hypothetical protein
MSTTLRNVPNLNTDMRLKQTRFWGGDRGSCLQVTQRRPQSLGPVSPVDSLFTSLQLTREQARELAVELTLFANEVEIEDLGAE